MLLYLHRHALSISKDLYSNAASTFNHQTILSAPVVNLLITVCYVLCDVGTQCVQVDAHSVGCTAVSWSPAAPPGSLLSGKPPAHAIARFATAGCDRTVRVSLLPVVFIVLTSAVPTSFHNTPTEVLWYIHQYVPVWQFQIQSLHSRIVVESYKLQIWHFDESKRQWAQQGQPLKGHTDWVRDVAWAPNLGMPMNTIASAGQDGKVLIWTEQNNQWSQLVGHSVPHT